MKVVLVNTFESNGGAAIACKRLMTALQKNGIDAKLVVRDKSSNDPTVISVNTSSLKRKINFIRFAWERFIIYVNNRFSKKKLFAVSIANTGTNISKLDAIKDADIIHIHWINQGFLSINNIKRLIDTGKPIVWTMHDMWAFTGICHYSWGCLNFYDKCGLCLFVAKPSTNDYSRKVWMQKENKFENKISPVAVSNWLAQQVNNSSIFRNTNPTVIPNAIDTYLFKPLNKVELRTKYNLPFDKKIILFSAAKINDPIKGFHFVKEAIDILYQADEIKNKLFLIILGEIKEDNAILSKLSCSHKHYGLLKDKNTIAQLYAASDVVINTSYYETFGQTLIEAMSCGAIPIAFDNGGSKDIIDHKVNGYIAKYKSAEDLTNGIHWILFKSNYEELQKSARQKVVDFYSEEVVAKQYIKLYKSLIK